MFHRFFSYFGRAGVQSYIGLFLFTYLAAWASNALLQTKFDLNQLSDLFKWLIGNHAVNSIFNSKYGEPIGGSDGTSNARTHPDDG
jgi:hypothetical protein